MGYDITQEFRNLVQRFAKDASSIDKSILRPIRRPNEFSKNAFDVSGHIKQSKEFIQSQKNRYIIPGMASDLERDHLEQEMISFIKTCSASVEHLSRSVQQSREDVDSDQAIAHRHGMVLIISEELKDLTLLLDHYRSERAMQMKSLQQRRKKQETKQENRIKSQLPPSSSRDSPIEATPQQQLVQEENRALFEELSSLSDRVIETEKMMIEISTLNQMLCSQIMNQSDQIEQVYNDAIKSSENLIRGNVHLRKAIDTSSSTRKYVLILMILAALILLFFDRFYS